MSYRTDSGKRSENHDSSSYLADTDLQTEVEALRSDAPLLDDEGFGALDLPGVLLRRASPVSDAEGPASEGVLGLGFALSERLDLLKARIDTLLDETDSRRSLHRAVQKAVKGELRELDHLLREVKVWSLGVNPSVDSRRTNLEREAISLKKTSWEERLRHWRDLVWLEKELQEVLERYKLAGAARGLTANEKEEED